MGLCASGPTSVHNPTVHDMAKHGLVVEICKYESEKLNTVNESGLTPLMVASANNQANIVQRLLSRNVLRDATDEHGQTALHFAVQSRNAFIVEMLAAESCTATTNIINITDWHGQSPLMQACHQGVLKIAQILLSEGADPNLADQDGVTPLLAACDQGHTEVVLFLLSEDAVDRNIVDAVGCTSLMRASGRGHLEIVRALLQEPNVDREAEDKEGRNALHHACGNEDMSVECSQMGEVAILLVENGANINAKDLYGKTPLDLWNRRCKQAKQRIMEAGEAMSYNAI